MTFFLDEPTELPAIKANNPSTDLVGGFWDGVGAAVTASSLENDANLIARRTTVQTQAALGWDAANRLDVDQIRERALARGISEPSIELFTRMMDRRPPNMPDDLQSVVFDLANEAAEAAPDEWADLDLSDEGIVEAANQILRAEYEDAQATVEMMPGSQAAARLLGGMIGMTADVKNLPFLALGGGGGSIWRVMGREALINAGAEAAFLPAQFEMADRLEIPDPDVVTQLSIAAVAGGALGGLTEAGVRGLTFFKQRNRTEPLMGLDEVRAQTLVDQVEDILTSDTPGAFDQILALHRQTADAPYLLENPINPRRPTLIDETASEPNWRQSISAIEAQWRSLGRDPEQLTGTYDEMVAAVEGAMSTRETIDGLEAAVEEARLADRSAARPLAQYLRDNHRSGGENLQIHPSGPAAEELRARGITPKTMPGLFSKNGRKEFDNLVADELETEFPGIIDATGTQRGSQYLDRDGFLEILTRDLDRDSTWLQSRADLEAREAELEAFLRSEDTTPTDDFLSGEPSEGGFFVDLNELEFVYGNNASIEIERGLDQYLERSGLTFLTREERAEVLEQLQTRGGEAEYLVERIAEREIELAVSPQPEDAFDDIPFPDAPAAARVDGQSPSSLGRPQRDPRAESPRNSGTDDPGETRTERTDAGEQIVTPGVEPVSQRQQLEARQSAPLQGGEAPADVGLFDLGARAQADFFDEPTSPKARSLQDGVISGFRDEIEANGPTVVDMVTEDGRILRTDQDVLDYLDEGDNFSSRIDLCGAAPGGEA